MIPMSDFSLSDLDGLAGLAALVNGLFLWPVIRSLKKLAVQHDERITQLEKRKPRAR